MKYLFFPLLLVLLFAPACAPNDASVTVKKPRTLKPLVLLSDADSWTSSGLDAYRDSLTKAGYRVLVSGFAGESTTELTERLPWLLQPGVELFIYDEKLAGPDGADSLRSALERLGQDTPVEILRR
ncbi:MAG: hypothetical protein AAF597_09805 [Bacteroidota bacterium]